MSHLYISHLISIKLYFRSPPADNMLKLQKSTSLGERKRTTAWCLVSLPTSLCVLKTSTPTLTGVAQLVGRHLAKQRVNGLTPRQGHTWVVVPGQGMGERRLINVSLSHRCFSPSLPLLPLSLKINKTFLKSISSPLKWTERIFFSAAFPETGGSRD